MLPTSVSITAVRLGPLWRGADFAGSLPFSLHAIIRIEESNASKIMPAWLLRRIRRSASPIGLSLDLIKATPQKQKRRALRDECATRRRLGFPFTFRSNRCRIERGE